MNTKKDELLRNEILHTTLAKMQVTDGNNTQQISYVVKRANLPNSVTLAAMSLLLSAKERLPVYIRSLKKRLALEKSAPSEGVLEKIETAQILANSTYMLFSISLIISSKYLIDRSYINRTWSNILMIERHLVNQYERALLEILDYQINIASGSLEELKCKMSSLCAKHEKKENKIVRSIKKIVSCLFKND